MADLCWPIANSDELAYNAEVYGSDIAGWCGAATAQTHAQWMMSLLVRRVFPQMRWSHAMQSLNPTRSIIRRGRDLLITGALLMLAGIVACVIAIFVGLLFGNTLPSIVTYGFLAVGVLIILGGIGVMIRGAGIRRDNEPALVVGDILTRELDSRFTLIRNLSRPGLGYIDALLIGPPGVLVFRLEEPAGVFSNEGSDWLERRDGGFRLSKINATRECVTDVYALRDYLSKRSLSRVPVFALVTFTSPEVQLSARQPVVPISDTRTMMTAIRRDFLAEDRIDQATIEQVVKLLYQ